MDNQNQRLSEQKKEAEALRNKRRGIYKEWAKSEVYTDLIEFMNRTAQAFDNSSKKGIGMDGKDVVVLSGEQRLSMVDKRAGIELILDYISNNVA